MTGGGAWEVKPTCSFRREFPDTAAAPLFRYQRTIHRARYRDGHAAPLGKCFDIASGEQSNFDQYCTAIDAAKSSIYIENQHLDVPEIFDRRDPFGCPSSTQTAARDPSSFC